MGRRKNHSRFESGVHFASIPVEILQSTAFTWLPHFARSVVVAMAGQFRGFNNGGLELTVADANEYGIGKAELYAGLRLATRTKLLIRTVPAKRSSGKGIPAKYALTWRVINEFPAYNLIETRDPSHAWDRFQTDAPRPRSLTDAERILGWRKPRISRRFLDTGGDSIEVSGTDQTNSLDRSVAPQTKTTNGSGPAQTR